MSLHPMIDSLVILLILGCVVLLLLIVSSFRINDTILDSEANLESLFGVSFFLCWMLGKSIYINVASLAFANGCTLSADIRMVRVWQWLVLRANG